MTEKTSPAVVETDGVVREVRSLVEHYVKPQIITLEEPDTGIKTLAVLRGNDVKVFNPETFDPYREEPLRRAGIAEMLSLDSLIEHTNRFSDDDSVVFADDNRKAPSLTTVLDYHRAGAEADPRFGRHRATFAFPLADEWLAWRDTHGQVMTMAEFAAFLENRIIDVLYLIPGEDSLPEDVQRMIDTLGGGDIVATPNKLMELSRGLSVNENSAVRQAVNLASGEGVINFQTEHTDAAGAPLKVPSLFLIAIPVFRNGPLYRIAARLRYRAAGGSIKFWFDLWRTDRTFDHAFAEAVERVRVETGLPVMLGKPEIAPIVMGVDFASATGSGSASQSMLAGQRR